MGVLTSNFSLILFDSCVELCWLGGNTGALRSSGLSKSPILNNFTCEFTHTGKITLPLLQRKCYCLIPPAALITFQPPQENKVRKKLIKDENFIEVMYQL